LPRWSLGWPDLECNSKYHGSPRFYALTRFVLSRVFHRLYGYEVLGTSNVPKQGGCLIVCNHQSYLDPPVVGSSIPHRQVHFMAKRELFAERILGPTIRALGSFPVSRGHADSSAFRAAMELLREGRVVGIFPEGTRSTGSSMQEWHAGVSFLASKAGVPIVPAAVRNTRRLFEERKVRSRKEPIQVLYGAPIDVPQGLSRVQLELLSAQAYQAVEKLLEVLHGSV
jgi:1-acyl-sn-glycerol-3-phosphate acyltransferase